MLPGCCADWEDKPTWLINRLYLRAHRLLADAFAQAGSRGHHFRLLAALKQHGPTSQADLETRVMGRPAPGQNSSCEGNSAGRSREVGYQPPSTKPPAVGEAPKLILRS
jgi:hypothetical protein